MPQIFDKIYLIGDTIKWDFNNYQPDMITICLGQNDGPNQDSTLYCSAYIGLIKAIRKYCPNADIVCLTSPMGDKTLTAVLKKYLTAIVANANAAGDRKVYKFFFSRSYNNGCGGHPDMGDHQLIASRIDGIYKAIKRLVNYLSNYIRLSMTETRLFNTLGSLKGESALFAIPIHHFVAFYKIKLIYPALSANLLLFFRLH